MKKIVTIVLVVGLIMIFTACSNAIEQNTEPSSTPTSTKKPEVPDSENTDAEEVNESNSENSEEIVTDQKEKDPLDEYSHEQIEYARVWLQLGPNPDIDELNVLHIPAGTPLNPDDETSANYPEDVIQLAGSRLIDGSVTYSGNGDGTINVYNVPLRWDGIYPAGEEFYKEIIENTKQVYIDAGDNEKIISLIKLIIIRD